MCPLLPISTEILGKPIFRLAFRKVKIWSILSDIINTKMSANSFCIHGHFYQPPREDPVTGRIPLERGAAPYQNWNERIHAECYRPNAELGNFGHISYNVGPTLFNWMVEHDPLTYGLIVAQDRANLAKFGVGNAMAQSYNHTILPLASPTDKVVQVMWGIEDFKHRFGHAPQGMWIPETAMDLETLAVLADCGIQFTILAPWQAKTEGIDTTEPYWVSLPGGKQITVFFFQRELSARISFDPNATADADKFVLDELAGLYNSEKEKRAEPQLVLLASDGELYGHHKPNRERFLSRLVNGASSSAGIQPVYPGRWLQMYPALKEVRLRDFTSWSCHHGVERWRDDCACNPGRGKWKRPLRKALDQLANELDWLYYDSVYPLISKPRVLRERYIHVLLGNVNVDRLINEFAGQALTSEQVLRIHLLLEAQRERQRMFTSCGWFFDDFDRLEPKNNLAYAAQAVRLSRLATGVDLAPQASANLRPVKSERTGLRGDTVFEDFMQRTWVMGRKNQPGLL